MKKNWGTLLLLGILALLVVIALWVKNIKGKSSTLNEEAKRFKVEDTASITKIILSDKKGNTVTLERKKEGWYVNDTYKVRPDAIQTLLYTIRMVEVKYPVPKSMKAGVLRTMAGFATQVKIYSGKKLIKQYYVGHNTQDYEGTFMLLTNLDEDKNYDDPFICHIPGFAGYLTVRYFTNAEDWRSNLVINATPPELNYVEYKNFEKPDSSFKIEIINTNELVVFNGNGQKINAQPIKVKQYLAYLQNLNANKLITHLNKKLVDSIAMIQPFAQLKLSYKNPPHIKTYSFYYKPSTPEINSKYGKDYKYDPDLLFVRFPAWETSETETALIQYYVFGKLFQNYSYFLKE
ncbi:MAG: hypothetical protein KatS3mg027_2147 [Bacteroidia bacterium]|nr:MAG: hypothetical protein KatS3mg027_2147 [Bacteroidia bacterium]